MTKATFMTIAIFILVVLSAFSSEHPISFVVTAEPVAINTLMVMKDDKPSTYSYGAGVFGRIGISSSFYGIAGIRYSFSSGDIRSLGSVDIGVEYRRGVFYSALMTSLYSMISYAEGIGDEEFITNGFPVDRMLWNGKIGLSFNIGSSPVIFTSGLSTDYFFFDYQNFIRSGLFISFGY